MPSINLFNTNENQPINTNKPESPTKSILETKTATVGLKTIPAAGTTAQGTSSEELISRATLSTSLSLNEIKDLSKNAEKALKARFSKDAVKSGSPNEEKALETLRTLSKESLKGFSLEALKAFSPKALLEIPDETLRSLPRKTQLSLLEHALSLAPGLDEGTRVAKDETTEQWQDYKKLETAFRNFDSYNPPSFDSPKSS